MACSCLAQHKKPRVRVCTRACTRARTPVPIVSFDSIRVKWRTETSLENRRKSQIVGGEASAVGAFEFQRSLEIVRLENCIPEPIRHESMRVEIGGRR